MRENMSRAFGASTPMAAFEEQAQRNMALFQQALSAWAPFAPGSMPMPGAPGADTSAEESAKDAQLAELRKQMKAMQEQLDAMAKR
jgi:polyhydroxyalkanoate synthesis regulator protein